MDSLEKLASHVPGFLYRFRLWNDGRTAVPYASEGIKHIYGVDPEQVREDATPFFDVLHPDDFLNTLETIRVSAETLTDWKHTYRVILPDGRIIWVKGESTPELLEDGSVLWHGYVTDITERRQQEDLLNLQASVAEHIKQGISIVDQQGRIIYANKTFNDLFGYQEGELVGKPVEMLNAGTLDQQKQMAENILSDLNIKGAWNGQLLNVRKDGSEFWSEAHITSYQHNHYGPVWATIQWDITETKKLEENLKLSEEKYRLAMQATTDGLWDWDVFTGHVYYSPAWNKILGLDINGNSYSDWEDRIHPEDKEAVLDSLKKHLEGKTSRWRKEHRLKNNADEWLWVLGRGEVVQRDENGAPLRMLGTMKNINARKQLENELIENKNSLEKIVKQRTIELDHAKEKAEKSNREKSRFLANMSHELRTPMHAIHSFTRLALKRETDEKNKRFLQNIDISAERLTTLLNDLLDLSKLESGKTELNLKESNLANLVQHTVQTLGGLINDHELIIDTSELASFNAFIDEKLITQVLINLLSNAIKFTPNNRTIKLKSIVLGQYFQISVEDEGIGVPEAELEKIFDSFVQSSKTMVDSGGTGLGLPITKEIIELHQGRIWVESPPEGKSRGSRFTFELPINPAAKT